MRWLTWLRSRKKCFPRVFLQFLARRIKGWTKKEGFITSIWAKSPGLLLHTIVLFSCQIWQKNDAKNSLIIRKQRRQFRQLFLTIRNHAFLNLLLSRSLSFYSAVVLAKNKSEGICHFSNITINLPKNSRLSRAGGISSILHTSNYLGSFKKIWKIEHKNKNLDEK